MKNLILLLFSFNLLAAGWIEKNINHIGKPDQTIVQIEKEAEFKVLKEILSEQLREFNLDPNLLWAEMDKKYLEKTLEFERNLQTKEKFYRFRDFLSSLVNVNRSRSPLNAREINITMKGLVDSASLRQLYTEYVLESIEDNNIYYQYVVMESQILLLNSNWQKLGIAREEVAALKKQVKVFWKQWLSNELNLPVSDLDSSKEPEGRVIKISIDVNLKYQRFNQALSQHKIKVDSSVTVQDTFSKDYVFFKNRNDTNINLNALVDVKKEVAQLIYNEPLNEFSLLSNIVKKEAPTDQKRKLMIQGYKNYSEFQNIVEKIVNSHILNSMKSRILKYSASGAELELSFSKQIDWEKLKQLFSEKHPHIRVF